MKLNQEILCIENKNDSFYKTLENILVAFVHYRPDVPYVKNMAFLAGMILTNCDEFDCFKCFVNLVHDHYFPKFFESWVGIIYKGAVVEINHSAQVLSGRCRGVQPQTC